MILVFVQSQVQSIIRRVRTAPFATPQNWEPRQREAFVLSRHDGMSIREIARVMGITEKGVQRNINLALKFLKANLPLFLIFMNL